MTRNEAATVSERCPIARGVGVVVMRAARLHAARRSVSRDHPSTGGWLDVQRAHDRARGVGGRS